MSSLLRFAELAQQLSETTKKLEKRAAMAGYLRELAVEDAARAVLYLAGQPFAETDLRKLSVGGSTLGKAVAQLSGPTPRPCTRLTGGMATWVPQP